MLRLAHPELAWGLLLVAAPLVIHLINRLRKQRIEWAAMEFLIESQRKHRTSVRLRELLLLLARMAAVAGIVLLTYETLQTRSTLRETVPRIAAGFLASNLSLGPKEYAWDKEAPAVVVAMPGNPKHKAF